MFPPGRANTEKLEGCAAAVIIETGPMAGDALLADSVTEVSPLAGRPGMGPFAVKTAGVPVSDFRPTAVGVGDEVGLTVEDDGGVRL